MIKSISDSIIDVGDNEDVDQFYRLYLDSHEMSELTRAGLLDEFSHLDFDEMRFQTNTIGCHLLVSSAKFHLNLL